MIALTFVHHLTDLLYPPFSYSHSGKLFANLFLQIRGSYRALKEVCEPQYLEEAKTKLIPRNHKENHLRWHWTLHKKNPPKCLSIRAIPDHETLQLVNAIQILVQFDTMQVRSEIRLHFVYCFD